MSSFNRILLFIILPTIAVLAYPPEMLVEGLPLLAIVFGFFILLGVLLWRGSSRALTLSIFIQGLNVIVRIMMFFNAGVPRIGQYNAAYMVISTLAMILSMYLLLRLDRADIRSQLVT
jgi:hypothetical protein